MTGKENNLEKQIEFLTEELSRLKSQVMELENHIKNIIPDNKASLQSSVANLSGTQKISAPKLYQNAPKLSGESDLWEWIKSASLFPKLATICFILVAALLLRTMTDGGFIEKTLGAYIGMFYSAVLIFSGWRMLLAKNHLGSVFPVAGAILMYLIVIETHAGFHAISSQAAYAILFMTFLAGSILSLRFKNSFLNCVAIIGTSFCAIAIDFPRPHFPFLALTLWSVSLVAFISFRRTPGCSWSRWFIFLLVTLVWFLWAAKLRVPLLRREEISPLLYMTWFHPLLALTASTFLVVSIAQSLKPHQPMNFFQMALPTMNGIWAFSAAWLIVSPWPRDPQLLGFIGVIAALLHFGMAAFLFWRDNTGNPGICVFTFAGAVLLLLSFPTATDSILLSLITWSVLGLGLAMLSGLCEIGGIRLTSYLLQITACATVLLSEKFTPSSATTIAPLFTVCILALMSSLQFRWCRTKPLSCSKGFFHSFDPHDHSAVTLLLAALINGFIALQLAASFILSVFLTNQANTLLGLQSILINGGAILFMLLALPKKNKEYMTIAVGLIMIGAFKVFGYDLFESQGLPLVLSVFSFGGMAVVASLVINRWLGQSHNQPQNT